MKENVIGVSGINATDNPGPGCAVARSLAEMKRRPRIVGLSYDVHDPGNYMHDLFENSFMMPYPTLGWNGLQKQLIEVQKQTGMNILVPCLDAELPLIIKNKEVLEKQGIATLLPTEKQFDLRSKDLLPELAKKIGCLHPKTKVVYGIDELVEVLKGEISLPAVVKGKFYKAYVVHNIDTAVLKATEIASEWGFPLLVQEKITGQEVNMIGLSDREGKVVGRVSIKKQLTTHLGKVWTAVTIRDQRLDQLCDRFGKETGWNGPFELECMTNEKGIYLIEINPRFPAWVYFATGVGVNLPERLVDLIHTNECESGLDYPVGKYLVRYSSEFVTDLSDFQNLLSSGNRKGI
jgi:carbamoyl-phosphate synthase large subunit